MTWNGGHPENLLWFVAGEVESTERERVLSHLARCEDCLEEATALASMMKSIVSQTHLDHVAPEDLVLFEEEDTRRESDKGLQIRAHLEECATCREELETITLARRREAVAPAIRVVRRDILVASAKRPKRHWMFAAAAAIVVAVAIGLVGLPQRPLEPAGPVAAKLVVLDAPRRGAAGGGRFEGAGPWAVRVLLPYGLEPTRFRVTIRREHMGALPGFDTLASSDEEGCLDMIVPDLPSMGRYELVLQPLTGEDTQERVYPFEQVASAPDPQAG